MNMYTLYLMKQDSNITPARINDSLLAQIAVETNGGGWTESQTREAIIWQAKALGLEDGERLAVNGRPGWFVERRATDG